MKNSIPQAEIQRAKQRQRMIGNSPELNRAVEVALLIAPTDVSVLVTGESGVGKESFPQIIHQNSARKHGPYVAVNCGAIPEGTIDSELFGHKKGSFTDAVTERSGYFEEANGGTIFLDEVGELPMPTQARLLRVLESGEYMKVGSSQVQRADIRIVAATNVDLEEAIRQGKFRQDLYYRLNTVTITLPPLRDRGGDLLLLFRLFASDFADKYHMPPIRLSEEAEQLMLRYRWPGNIRELKNLVERLSVIAEDRLISEQVLLDQLPPNADQRHPALITAGQSPFGIGGGGGEPGFSESQQQMGAIYGMMREMKMSINDLSQLLYHVLQGQQQGITPRPAILGPDVVLTGEAPQPNTKATTAAEAEFQDIVDDGHILTLEEMEQKYIEMVLRHNNGVRKKTAEDLNISERTLYRKLK